MCSSSLFHSILLCENSTTDSSTLLLMDIEAVFKFAIKNAAVVSLCTSSRERLGLGLGAELQAHREGPELASRWLH